MQDKRGAGRYKSRLEFHRPSEEVNEYNEPGTEFIKVYEMVPAERLDNVTTDSESLDGKVVNSSNVTEWLLRFLPGFEIKSSWRIRDMMTGRWYSIISPVTETGTQQGLRVKSKLVE